jgi:UDP-N-acetylmuramoylalanine--D-glutamate ligase
MSPAQDEAWRRSEPGPPVSLPRSALVVGLGVTGEAAALALAGAGVAVTAVDRSDALDTRRLSAVGVEVRLGDEEDASVLDDVELVVKGPGVPPRAPLVRAARERGLPVWSEVELGFRLLGGNPLVGVTGTKGKTTTVRLLGAMFEAAGRAVVLSGNEHTPLSEVALTVEAGTTVLCELSSFALADVETLACDVALLLNLEPDHLNWHGTFEEYRAAKLRIFERARRAVVPRGSGLAGVEFAADDPLPAEPLIRGEHNRANAAAATAVARLSGIPDDAIAEALRSFPGVPHRLEFVAELAGVRYINDSKATNTAAARRGIAAYADAPLHLILGGSRKGEDFTALAAELPPTVRSIHLIGETADDIAAALDAAGRVYTRDDTLERALAAAHAAAEPGDVVLLSPASASFDQFANFEARGDAFRRLVGALA